MNEIMDLMTIFNRFFKGTDLSEMLMVLIKIKLIQAAFHNQLTRLFRHNNNKMFKYLMGLTIKIKLAQLSLMKQIIKE